MAFSSTDPMQSLERLRAYAAVALVPFLDAPSCDEQSALNAAAAMLDDYNAMTPKELQLSTQIIALGWAVLACLSASMMVKERSIEDMLRFQDSAVALDRNAHRIRKALTARQKERLKNPALLTVENTSWDEGVFQLVVNQALDKMTEANAELATLTGTNPPADQGWTPVKRQAEQKPRVRTTRRMRG